MACLLACEQTDRHACVRGYPELLLFRLLAFLALHASTPDPFPFPSFPSLFPSSSRRRVLCYCSQGEYGVELQVQLPVQRMRGMTEVGGWVRVMT